MPGYGKGIEVFGIRIYKGSLKIGGGVGC